MSLLVFRFVRKSKISNLMKTSTNPLKIKVSEMALFDDRQNIANCSRIFYAYFESIPSSIVMYGINYKSAMKWINCALSDQIAKKHSRQFRNYTAKKMKYTVINYVLKCGIVIKVEEVGDVMLLYSDESENVAEKIANEMRKLRRITRTSSLSIIVNEGNCLKLVDIKSKKPKLSISENYNDDLASLHHRLLKDLKKKDNSGLYLFHGIPGTGKSTYIRCLMHYLNKRVIFLPPKVAGNLDSPELVSILIAEPNSVLIIEDAEDLLVSREKDNASSISMLLNLTDGMLGESLGIQVICTFNSSLVNIDRALMRKGRLKAMYEFKPLSIMKSMSLLNKLGISERIVKEPMTLADIYNIHEQKFEFNLQNRKTIGFAHTL